MDYLAVDLGAESGRVVRGTLAEGRLELEVVGRFANRPVLLPDGLHWDVLALFAGIKDELLRFRHRFNRLPVGISCDSWGVDFALLDKRGGLLANPFHYRDRRTDGVMARVLERCPAAEIYRNTGIQFMPINTIYQLYALAESDDPSLRGAECLLMIADLFNYFLSGEKAQEQTLASTSQLFDPTRGEWARPLFETLALPLKVMPRVVPSATALGGLRPALAAELGLGKRQATVFAGVSHDTAAAVAACPADGRRPFAYLSSGTWSLFGVELARPRLGADAMAAGFTNEGGAGGTTRFLRNITGLWILQECRRKWTVEDGRETGYPELVALAAREKPFRFLVDVDDPLFLAPRDMVAEIGEFCRRTGQARPASRGQVVRLVLEGLALRYARALNQARELLPGDAHPEVIHIMGGGSRNELLNQFTADATGLPVQAGPVEATAAGNILVQAKAAGRIGSIAEAREIVRRSFEPAEYRPRDHDAWAEAGNRLEKLCGR